MIELEILDRAIEKYNPKYVIGLFSGGHDSLVATHVASLHPRFSFACHLNTGIGIEETRVFVRETCEGWGIELREYKAAGYTSPDGTPTPQIYDDFVSGAGRGYSGGFPGPPMHTFMFNRLKERPLRAMIRDLNRNSKDKTLLVTGARSQESHRRNGNFRGDKTHSKIERDADMYADVFEGTKVFCFPILDMDKTAVNQYIKAHNLRRNPVVDKLHMSGECLCGAFAHPGELEEIAFWFPDVAARIKELEKRVIAAGYPWGWEERPPKWYGKVKDGQRFLPGLEPPNLAESILCSSCALMSKSP